MADRSSECIPCGRLPPADAGCCTTARCGICPLTIACFPARGGNSGRARHHAAPTGQPLAGLLCTIAVTPISAAQPSVGQRGQASWYGEFHEGKLMANQRPFRMDEATVAHRTLPLGTLIEVRNLKNGRFVDAEVTDRGPYVRGRMLDVSKAVAEELDMLEGGTAAVEIRVIQLGG